MSIIISNIVYMFKTKNGIEYKSIKPEDISNTIRYIHRKLYFQNLGAQIVIKKNSIEIKNVYDIKTGKNVISKTGMIYDIISEEFKKSYLQAKVNWK